jgi:hypothetical protein
VRGIINRKKLDRILYLLSVLILSAACGDGVIDPSDFGAGSPPPTFDIELRYVGDPPAQAAAFSAAVSRWEEVITGDLPDATVDFPGPACHDAMRETVDDVVIFVKVTSIDGRGGKLGQAGPCLVRDESQLPITGRLILDRADLDVAEAAGFLDDLVLHEIGHILGFGTLWERFGLLSGVNSTDPRFTGSRAADALDDIWGASGTGNGVPVENRGGAGIRNNHWRQSVFGSELMSSALAIGANPLSSISVTSLGDMGYTVDVSKADEFSLDVAPQMGAIQTVQIGTEALLKPMFSVEPSGQVLRLER